jgi:hypothetical protein
MKSLRLSIALLSLSFIVFHSCRNDIKLNADYKQIMVVYGLLDNNDTTHYIRIQKAFQNTDASAQTISQNPDSLYFDTIEASVTDLTTGASWQLQKETSIIKEPGYFQNKVNILYKFKGTLDATHRYRLFARDLKTGYFVTSETDIVGYPTKIFSPAGDTIDILANKQMKMQFSSGRNAKSYDLFFRFVYTEYDSVTNNYIDSKDVDFYISRQRPTNSLSGNEDITESIETEDMITFIGNSIPPAKGIKRVASFLRACHAGAADDLNIYLDVSKPSIGIVQKKPEYSNVNNGYGIFSSRNVYFRTHPLNWATQKTLHDHPATKGLGFNF